MLLHRIHLNPRCREARRDLSDPYQLHATLCRAFSDSNENCPPSQFLWRLEPETDINGYPRILVQSQRIADWTGIGIHRWLENADTSVDLRERLKLKSLKAGQRFRFRLRANPCVTRNGKRLGLLRTEEQEAWLERKGLQGGFSLPRLASFDFSESSGNRIDVYVSHAQMLRGRQHNGNAIHIFSVLYDGILAVTDPEQFTKVLQAGIGHGKVLGLGLLSVVALE